MRHNINVLIALGESVYTADMVKVGTIRKPAKVALRLVAAGGETIGQIEIPLTFKVADLQPLRAIGAARMEVAK